jgi:hypothetical protein
LCAGGSPNGVGTPNHSSIAPFSNISGMSSGAGDLMGATIGMGNNSSMLNGNDYLIYALLAEGDFVFNIILVLKCFQLLAFQAIVMD